MDWRLLIFGSILVLSVAWAIAVVIRKVRTAERDPLARERVRLAQVLDEIRSMQALVELQRAGLRDADSAVESLLAQVRNLRDAVEFASRRHADETAKHIDELRVAVREAESWHLGSERDSERLVYLLRESAAGFSEAVRYLRPLEESRGIEHAAKRDPIQVSWAMPAAVRPGATFEMFVALHLAGIHPFSVRAQATIREDMARVSVTRGSLVELRLTLPEGLVAEDPSARLEWIPPKSLAQFSITASPSLGEGRYTIKVVLLAGEIELTRFYVEAHVKQRARDVDVAALVSGGASSVPKSAFASYSHKDQVEVLARIAALEALGINVYIDQLGLREGELWNEALEREILDRETLVLFWSANAASSAYVKREWKTALDAKGIHAIRPNALESPDRVPLPAELSALHFGSPLTALAKARASKSILGRKRA